MLRKINPELAVLIIGRVLQIIIALVAIKLATKLLSAFEMGNFYLIVSIAGFFGLFLVGPVGQYINRKTHQWYEEKNIINIFYIYNYYIVFLSFLSIGIIYILHSFNITNNMELFSLSMVLFVYILSHTWNQTIIPMINMLEHRISFVVFTLISQFLFLILAYILIMFFAKEGLIWFFGQAAAFGVVAIGAFIYFRKKIQNNFNIAVAHKMININNFKNILKFSAPLFVSSLFFWMQSQSYPIIINKNIGSEFLGYFGVGMAIALAISSAFETVIMQYIYPQMYKSMKDENRFSAMISNIINVILPVYLMLSVYVSLYAVYINSILVDHKYYSSYIFVIFGIWVLFYRMSSNIVSNIAHAKMDTKSLIVPNFIGALTAVFGVLIATKLENYQYYIPIALIISSMVSFVYLFYKMGLFYKIDIQMDNFYFILKYSIPLTFGLLFYTYANNIFYSIIVVGVSGIYFLYVLYKLINTRKLSE